MSKDSIADQLKQPLDVGRVKKRQGGGGTSLSYIETHDVITSLNRIFGYDAWTFELLNFEQIPNPKGFTYRQAVSLTVNIDGKSVRRQDVGIGQATNGNGDQMEKGMKEAASDGLKRCARTFGEQFGNSLYEKDAPEHRGEQRARLATQDQLAACEDARVKAVALGFLTKKGVEPQPTQDGADEEAVKAKINVFWTYIKKTAPQPTSLSATAAVREAAAHTSPEAAAEIAEVFPDQPDEVLEHAKEVFGAQEVPKVEKKSSIAGDTRAIHRLRSAAIAVYGEREANNQIEKQAGKLITEMTTDEKIDMAVRFEEAVQEREPAAA